MLAEAHLGRDPQAPPAIADKFRTWPRAAPVVIAVAAKVRTGHAIPEIEQVLSAGASAMNVLNAAHALGFAGMWVTGPSAYDPAVLRALGLDGGDRLVGFIALGTPAGAARVEPRRFDRHAFVSEWTGL
jgi:nitroreductase